MGLSMSNTDWHQAGQAMMTNTGPLTASIRTMELLTWLQHYTDGFRKEISCMIEEKNRGNVSRQYIDIRLNEIAETLNRYNKARNKMFNKLLAEPETSTLQKTRDEKELVFKTEPFVKDTPKEVNENERLDEKSVETKNQKAIIKQLEQRNDELLQRLSKLASDRLVLNNPNIANLSDVNRPTKLAELYNELFDNEYTDAEESLLDCGMEKTDIAKTLRTTLLSTYDFCKRKSTQLIQTVEGAVTKLFDEYKMSMLTKERVGSLQNDVYLMHMWRHKSVQGTESTYEDLGATVSQALDKGKLEEKLKQLRKEVSIAILPLVQKAYLKARWDKQCIQALKPFIRKCLQVTWCMVVQSPPLMFAPSEELDGSKFEVNKYRVYTKSGPIVDYVVWPALLLHEEGPLLAKGVAEGRKE